MKNRIVPGTTQKFCKSHLQCLRPRKRTPHPAFGGNLICPTTLTCPSAAASLWRDKADILSRSHGRGIYFVGRLHRVVACSNPGLISIAPSAQFQFASTLCAFAAWRLCVEFDASLYPCPPAVLAPVAAGPWLKSSRPLFRQIIQPRLHAVAGFRRQFKNPRVMAHAFQILQGQFAVEPRRRGQCRFSSPPRRAPNETSADISAACPRLR